MDREPKQTNSFLKGIALAIPFLLFFFGIFCASMYLFTTVVEETSYFSLLVGDSARQEIEEHDPEFIPAPRPSRLSRIPSISYGSRFARLNVTWGENDGWDIVDIPVRLGADKKILKKGAGMSFGSAFPGEAGCTIISAHVTRDFAELEDTPIGATVTIETTYGPYTYVVDECIQGVSGTDRWYMDSGEDCDLMLYTCYPRNNHGERRTERCVLRCTLTDGVEVQP